MSLVDGAALGSSIHALHQLLYADEDDHPTNWVDHCFFATAGSTVVIGSGMGFGVLATFSDGENAKKLALVGGAKVPDEDYEDGERITSLSTMSFKAKASDVDTIAAAVVGYSSGYVRLFSEAGDLIIEQMLHPAAVLRLRPQPAASSGAPPDQAVLYPDAVVVIDGFSLSHAVRACFNQVQRGADPAEFDCPPLALKKWGLREQDTVHDIVCLGAEPVTAYDNLIVGRIGTSSVHTYVACGYRPMLAVYSTLGVDRPFFSAAALATKVASKLGAAMFGVVSSFWGKAKEPELGSHHGSGEQSVRTSSRPLSDVAKQGAAALPLEYALDDRRRRIVSLEPCPLGNAIAATDDFGRVLLLDSASGTITNVWKGYREAQVGWVLAKENTASRSCSYLVIYAPRRGLLEVWAPSLQFRAAAWNVGLEARLVQRISVPGSEFSDCFVMLADGSVREVVVPFSSIVDFVAGGNLEDRGLLRTIQSLLDPYAPPSSRPDSRTSNDPEVVAERGKVSAPSELKTRLCKAIAKLSAAGSLELTLKLLTEAEVPDHIMVASVAALRTVASEAAAGTANPQGQDSFSDVVGSIAACERLITAHSTAKKLGVVTLGLLPPCSKTGLIDPRAGLAALQLDEVEAARLGAAIVAWGRANTDEVAASGVVAEGSHDAIDLGLGTFIRGIQRQCHLSASATDAELPKARAVPDGEVLELARFCFQSILSGCCNVEDLAAALKLTGLPRTALLELLICWMLSLPLCVLMDPAVIDCARDVLSAVLSFEQSECSAMTAPTDTNREASTLGEFEGNVFWWETLIRRRTAASVRLAQALLIGLVGRGVTAIAGGALEAWSCALLRIEDALCLQTVLAGNGAVLLYPVAQLAENGGLLTAAGVHLLELGLVPSDISTEVESPTSAAATALARLRQRFSSTLSPTTLSIWCFGRLLREWEESSGSADVLLRALTFAAVCPHEGLRRAVVHAAWDRTVRKQFATLVGLIMKVGKVPKERLCIQKLGMNSANTVVFAEQVRQLLELLMVSPSTTPDSTVPELFDQRWDDPAAFEGSSVLPDGCSLVVAVRDVAGLKPEIIEHHLALASVVSAILRFDIRSIRPLEMFPEHVCGMFFSPLDCDHPDLGRPAMCDPGAENKVYDEPEQAAAAASVAALVSARRQFLSRAIAASISSRIDLCGCNNKKAEQSVLKLASQLDLDNDKALMRQYVLNLFEMGFDSEADSEMARVSRPDLLAEELLNLAARRLQVLTDESCSPGAMSLISKLPTSVYAWSSRVEQGGIGRLPAVPVGLEGVCGLLRRVQSISASDSALRSQATTLLPPLAALVQGEKRVIASEGFAQV